MKSNATPYVRLPPRLTVVFTLARLLQRMELSTAPIDARQYRSVATRLAEELGTVPADESLAAVLQAHPAAAELYENLYYAHAGLCRTPLELAAEAEAETLALLARLGRST
jgi:hypothetical protein